LIIQHNTSKGRFYETPHGLFPSVTTVLSSLPSPELDAWRERVGREQADLISKRATDRGSRLHAYCESILKKEEPKKLDILLFFGIGSCWIDGLFL
jgi:hypothetical protein